MDELKECPICADMEVKPLRCICNADGKVMQIYTGPERSDELAFRVRKGTRRTRKVLLTEAAAQLEKEDQR